MLDIHCSCERLWLENTEYRVIQSIVTNISKNTHVCSKKYPYVNRHCMCSENRDDMMFSLKHLTNMYIFFLFKKITKCCNHITFIRKIVFSLVVKHMRNSSSQMARVLTL